MAFETLFTQIENNLDELIQPIKNKEILGGLNLRRAVHLPVAVALQNQLNIPFLFITDRNDRALALWEELSLWKPDLNRAIFAEPNTLYYENIPWGNQVRRDRLSVLAQLAKLQIPGEKPSESPPFIVASIRAVMTRTMPRRDFLKATKSLKVGALHPITELVQFWNDIGYERVNTVTEPCQYSRRGGILDIWATSSTHPLRIEFFGDEIESVRSFDPSTQRTIKNAQLHQRIMIPPAREYLLSEQTDLELADGEEINEFYLPLLHTFPASILDYLPSNALVLIDNLDLLQETAVEIDEKAMEMRQAVIRERNITEDFPSPYLTWSEIEDNLSTHDTIHLGFDSEEHSPDNLTQSFQSFFNSEEHFAGRVKLFIEHLQDLIEKNEVVWVVSRQKSRLQELWQEQTASLTYSPAVEQNPRFASGSISEGWCFAPPNQTPIHVFSDSEIFGIRPPEVRQRKRVVSLDPEGDYSDLQPGDYVVHVDHGIGIFIGLVTRTIDNIDREYLCIEYANNTQLFVPVYQADRVARYIGSDKRQPSLSHLGSPEWRNVKNYVKEAVVEVAQDLLELYAKRNAIEGYTFSQDTHWQEELEASFPYIETEDQIKVLKEVKEDMESSRPMDRLICGDVGYGKTEVALRAAFKCVMDGKQVAILVPTTILAQQHFETFCQRLSPFPIEVEMLSRFRTPQQQQDIIERLALGKIDIIIGTHRLLSKDVQFKDLGLLIIDEEQRFGVIHKEKLKKMRTEVDVLTLTATPIPRTLYLALSGIRDISTINTPPEERTPILTHVGAYSPDLIRKAILRELERGGQVFFVHNRVQTIYAMLHHIEKLVPEARISVAHGQMPEHELAERMRQFSNGEVDVLLSTSIIESGLDIPNANTLIVDRADTFGLAQLYQLRGRVGRGAQRAYAYFFRHRRKNPTPEGQQRLETIAENTQLGSGYNIAMRDLEIRGTGDILGTRQSGQVSAIGLHLYTRFLADAVQRLKKSNVIPQVPPEPESLPDEVSLGVSVELPLPANIPISYVPDKTMRLRLYRRLAHIQSLAEIDELSDEFQDRFGPLPEMTRNLFYQLKVKILAQKAGVSTINLDNGQLAIKFPDENIPDLAFNLHPAVRIGKTAIWFAYSTLPNWQEVLIEILNTLAQTFQLVKEFQ